MAVRCKNLSLSLSHTHTHTHRGTVWAKWRVMLNTAVHILTRGPYSEQIKKQILCKCNIIPIPCTEDNILHTTSTKRTLHI